jgi:hypothetical protein
MQRDAEFLRNPAGVLEVFCGRAISLFVFFPVVHEQALHIMAGPQQQQRRDGRIHAARQAHDDPLAHQALCAIACTDIWVRASSP